MNIDEIRRLLNSFYNGDISPEDVEVLKKYFAGTDNIPDDLLLDAKIFRAMNVEKASVPADLEQRILASTIADSAFTRRKKWNLKAIISVAASLAIIVSVALTLLQAINLKHRCSISRWPHRCKSRMRMLVATFRLNGHWHVKRLRSRLSGTRLTFLPAVCRLNKLPSLTA